jgi:two-component system, NtrC family, sensor kinase
MVKYVINLPAARPKMALLLQKLPTLLVLAVLVSIFVSLQRHVRSPRLRLWTLAWGLIFVHFLVQVFEDRAGLAGQLAFATDLVCLQLSGVVFLVSLTTAVEVRRRRWALLAVIGLPVTLYTLALAFDKDMPWFYIACLASAVIAGVVWLFKFRKLQSPFGAVLLTSLVLATGWAINHAWHHRYTPGMIAALTLSFGISAILFWRRFPRWSPGVVTVVGGFAAWAAVFPAAMLMDWIFPEISLNPELWNVPKFLVAFGMILAMVEDKSRTIEEGGAREHDLNRQLERFSSVTSRLLSGSDVNGLCDEIAAAITETSTFERCAVVLSNDDRSLYLAGGHGLDPEMRGALKQSLRHQTTDSIAQVCSVGRVVSRQSYLLKHKQIAKYQPVRSQRQLPRGPHWEDGDEVVVPLLSPRGAYVGCISLDDPREPSRVTFEEMSKIELLAGDLAVAIENAALHRQLLRTEKLAGLGQLVAGVAHELNNPLTAVVGYNELLYDEVRDETTRQKLEKIRREAQRMKRIIENLLRFSRQNSHEGKASNPEQVLREVLMLHEYNAGMLGVTLQSKIDPNLPLVNINEDQLKQILLNLLNNAVDAVEDAEEKVISIEALRYGERVMIRFEDSGPGFADLNRAFDPFYTTKPVGRGTGLGLSICYGIVKEHLGEIHIRNLSEGGASVSIELPATDQAGAAPPTVKTASVGS